ncbi:MAG: hypothetical protein ACOX8S_08020 [Christensenellales bacterium]|jgi:Ser/Thr protein kinase RdoA (MazF antagonist)
MISQDLLEFAAKSYDFGADTLEHMPRKSGKIMNEVYIFRKDEKEYIIKFEPFSVERKNQLRETKAAMDFNYFLSENNVSVSAPLKTASCSGGELALASGGYMITASARLRGAPGHMPEATAKCLSTGAG